MSRVMGTLNGSISLQVLITYSTIFRVATAFWFGIERYKKSDNTLINLLRCLLPHLDQDVLNSGSSIAQGNMFMSLETFKWLVQNAVAPFQERGLQERFEIALRTADSVRFYRKFVHYINFLLSGQKVDFVVAAARDKLGRSFLHFAAINFAMQYYQTIRGHLMPEIMPSRADLVTWSDMDRNDLFILIRSLAKSSCAHTLHQQASSDESGDPELFTPLMTVFRVIYRFFNGFHNEKKQRSGNFDWKTQLTHFQTGVRAWLELLLQAGINLEDYGRREFRHHLKSRASLEFPFFDRSSRHKAAEYRKAMEWESLTSVDYLIYYRKLRLVSFQYGPLPSDWHFWVTEAMEYYFLEFWDMVDHPERTIPGAWDDFEEGAFEEQDIDYGLSWTQVDDDDCLDCACGTFKSKGDGD